MKSGVATRSDPQTGSEAKTAIRRLDRKSGADLTCVRLTRVAAGLVGLAKWAIDDFLREIRKRRHRFDTSTPAPTVRDIGSAAAANLGTSEFSIMGSWLGPMDAFSFLLSQEKLGGKGQSEGDGSS
jgi:hypothetical protein